MDDQAYHMAEEAGVLSGDQYAYGAVPDCGNQRF